jgi:hypothetical protein
LNSTILISFEIGQQFFFPHSCFLLSALLTRAAQHPAAHQRPIAASVASILLRLADKWGRVVIPSAGSHPRARSGSDHAGRASALCPSPWSWARMLRRPPLGIFSHRRRSSLAFLPPNRNTQAAAISNPRPPSPPLILSVAASPSVWSSSGGSRGGEEAARVACGRSRAVCFP